MQDSYRRFLNMYGEVVMEIPHHDFESAMERLKHEVGAKQDSDLTGGQLRSLCVQFKEIYKKVNIAQGILFLLNELQQDNGCASCH